jgi:hypothetical protein
MPTRLSSRLATQVASPESTAHPDRVEIDTDGQKVAVVAEEVSGADREVAWRHITAVGARYAKDAQRTDGELPIIRLTARQRQWLSQGGVEASRPVLPRKG